MPPTSPPSDAAPAATIVRRLRIEGRVQGVFYRAWTVEQARALELSGWVRNCRDGSVEAVIGGPQDRVEKMIIQCRQGPPAARVDRVTVAPASLEEAPTPFEKRPTD